MGLTAALSDSELSVAPGSDTSCLISVRNSGPAGDQVSLSVTGPAADWSTVEPPVLTVPPGEYRTARITLHPPRSPVVTAGVVEFAVLVESMVEPADSPVAEGAVEVGAFLDIAATLRPPRSRGRRRGIHRLIVINRGNTPVPATVHLSDPDAALRFRVEHARLATDPGVADELTVRVVPRERFLRGPDRSRPFRVVVAPEQGEPVVVEAEMVQQPTLAPWVVPALVTGLVMVVAGAVLWSGLVRPTIRSVASDTVNVRLSPLASAVGQAEREAREAHQVAASTAANLGPNGLGSGGSPSPSVPPSPRPVDFRIQANAAPRKDNGFNTYVARGQSSRPVDITDIQLQNPYGDSGIVEIRRNRTVWLRFALDNFRDYDDHFVVPVHFAKGASVTFAVSCKNPGGRHCTPALTFSGRTPG
jgi:hypothetical protein